MVISTPLWAKLKGVNSEGELHVFPLSIREYYGRYYNINRGVLNLAPDWNYNGLNKNNPNFTVNDSTSFLNFPLNNIGIIAPYWLLIDKSVGQQQSSEQIGLRFREITEITPLNTNKARGVILNSRVAVGDWYADNDAVAYYSSDKFSLIFAMNYLYEDNRVKLLEGEKGFPDVNRYNNFIDFTFRPQDNIQFKIINLNFFAHANDNISNLLEAVNDFQHQFLKQSTYGNFLLASYEAAPEDQSLWHYYSHISVSNQWMSLNQKPDKLLQNYNLYYDTIDYKIQNISNFHNIFHNDLSLIYGLKVTRSSTSNHHINEVFTWPQGMETDYKMYLKGEINIANINRIYLLPGVSIKREVYKTQGNKAYRLYNLDPQLELDFRLTDNIKLYSSYLYTTRLPHTYEKYINGKYFYNSHYVNFMPNLDLHKQRSHEWRMGLLAHYTLNEDFTLNLSLESLYDRYSDYIDYSFINNSQITFNNVPRVNSNGYQTLLAIKAYNWNTNFTFNILNGKANPGEYLLNLHPHTMALDIAYSFPTPRLTVGVKTTFVHKFSKYHCNYPFETPKLPGYALADIYFTYKSLNNKLALEVTVENIFNKQYFLPYLCNKQQDRKYILQFNVQV